MAELGTANIGGRAVPAWVLESTAEQVDNSKWFSRPNLLDNWYFVGGGSQQGGGQFPINQRGQMSYTGVGCGIDRWYLNLSSATAGGIQILDDCIQFIANGGTHTMQQKIEGLGQLSGKTVTLSVLVDAFGLVSVTTALGSITYKYFNGSTSADGYMSVELLSSGIVNVVIGSSGTARKIYATKLELGPTQTLAYQDEDGNWQLFETPDYGEELAKCQRYFWNSSLSPNGFSILGYALAANQAMAYLLIELPVSLRAEITPSLSTINFSNLIFIGTNGLETLVHSWMIDNASAGDKVLIQCQGTFITGQTYLVVLTNSETLSVSAEP